MKRPSQNGWSAGEVFDALGRGDADAAGRHAEQMAGIAERRGSPDLAAMALELRGCIERGVASRAAGPT